MEPVPDPDLPTLDEWWSDFTRALLVKQIRPKTLRAYGQARDRYVRFADEHGFPTAPAAVRKQHIELFLVQLGQTNAAVTVVNTHQVLSRFFKWVALEDGMPSPLDRIPKPRANATRPAILRDDDLRAIVAACKGRTFVDHRDMAMVRILIDSGCRLGELVGISREDVDRDRREIAIDGKSGKRLITYGARTAEALDRYWRFRAKHRHHMLPDLWLGRLGPMTNSGIHQVVKGRARAAGLVGVHAHIFRHTATHALLTAGLREADVETLMGWQGPSMIRRYAASAAGERALKAYRSPGDRL
jgi:integrase